MFKRQTGFTLIELIVVIVILGILAATALPKYMGIQSSARVAVLNGGRGAVAAAMNIASATQQAQGLASNIGITLDGVSITMANRYPDGPGILLASGLSAEYSTASTATTATVQVTSASTLTGCQFTYAGATATLPPVITVTSTTGC